MEERIKKTIYIAGQISNSLGKPESSYPEGLREWLAASPKNSRLFNSIENGEELYSRIELYDSIDPEEEWNLLQAKRPAKKVRLTYKWRWISTIAAALLIAFTIIYSLIPSDDVHLAANTPFTGEEMIPGKTLATLSVGESNISIDENMEIVTKNGLMVVINQLDKPIYANQNQDMPQISKLVVPRGGEYYIELEEGTKVWLNADSELQFPEYFEKDKRVISIKGEAYIEVSHDEKKPFYVKTGNVQVHVTGTSFNIQNFSNESTLSIALSEGKVLMEDAQGKLLAELEPSRQFIMNQTTETFRVETVDLQAVLAWKDGTFVFDKEPLISIVRKLERWYNTQIEVAPSLQNRRYSGSLNKHNTMEEIVNILQKTRELKFVKDQHQNIKIIPVESN